MNTKFITLNCVIPQSSAAGTYAFTTELPKDFKSCTGIAVVKRNAGGLTAIDMKIEDSEGSTLADFMDTSVYEITEGIAPAQRFRDDLQFPVPMNNLKTVVYLKTTATNSSAAVNFQVVFRVTK